MYEACLLMLSLLLTYVKLTYHALILFLLTIFKYVQTLILCIISIVST